jgi:prepilin-type N-terminal cleavage/methylation domain-containing protein
MRKTFLWLFKLQTNQQINKGFTLIELLVAAIVSVLVITPLLGLAVSLLKTDELEAARANTEQEMQNALDFIARDLEQAVYIYDSTGISAIEEELPHSGNDDINPILVFWKQEYIPDIVPIASKPRDTEFDCGANPKKCDDAQVYSLVAYYLRTDDSETWSDAARIARFQIRDRVRDPYADPDSSGDIPTVNVASDLANKDDGFALFNPNANNTLEASMNAWTKASGAYTKDLEVLLDYVYQGSKAPNLVPNDGSNPNCSTVFPNADSSEIEAVGNNNGGFFACLNSETTIAKVFLRGNVAARMDRDIEYNENKPALFPTASSSVQGRGSLGLR